MKNDCFYRAVSKQLFNLGENENDAQLTDVVRVEICEWMETNFKSGKRSEMHEEHWEQIFYAYPCFKFQDAREKYIKHLRNGAMASGMEALFCSYIYKRPVCVWKDKNGDPEIMNPWLSREPPIMLLHSKNHWSVFNY